MDHRHRVRRTANLCLEQLVDAHVRRIGRCRPVQLLQQIRPLGGRQKLNPPHRLPRINLHSTQQILHMLGHTVDLLGLQATCIKVPSKAPI